LLQGVNDPIAIRAKAVENLVFAVNSLTELEKRRMGYGKQEFITKCSFNGRQCSVEEWVLLSFRWLFWHNVAIQYHFFLFFLFSDFSLYVDPTFGNCFTFNAHSESNVRSERAGPNYGQ
jgi:acid-sensing ion channel, other